MPIHVNGVITGKLLESATLRVQARSNSKEQFAASPDLAKEIVNAITDGFTAYKTMSTQALASERVKEGLKEVLLGTGLLWEDLRATQDP